MKFRKARREDVKRIVEMYADDHLGATREVSTDPIPQSYYDAFAEIDDNPGVELIVAVDDQEQIVGTLQLTFMRFLTFQGGLRAQIEAVRVHSSARGRGIGHQMAQWAIIRARERKAHMIQLTSDKSRPDAIRFYEDLGFKVSHEGLKMKL